jgi:hypothetical protein
MVDGGNRSLIYPQVPFLTCSSDLKPHMAADFDDLDRHVLGQVLKVFS